MLNIGYLFCNIFKYNCLIYVINVIKIVPNVFEDPDVVRINLKTQHKALQNYKSIPLIIF